MNYCNESPSYHLKKIPHDCNEDYYFSTLSSHGKERIKRYNTWTWGKTKRNAGFSEKELAVFKNVVIRCRTSGISYHKIGGAFNISSKTVYEWVKQTGHFVNPLKNMNWYVFKTKPLHVNINDIAKALWSNLHAWRNGWITEITIDNILNGETIH